MISTYNHLAVSYMPTTALRSNSSHNKKELKNTYNNIVKMSKTSPLYMFKLTDDNQDFALNVKNASYSLSSSLDDFSKNEALFEKNSFASSDPGIVNVVMNDRSHNSDMEDFFITVHELATNQENTGRSVYKESSGLSAGRYSFNISIYDEQYSFQFPVSPGQNNRDIQSRLADFITGSDIGITASVEDDRSQEKSYIKLTTSFTGINSDNTPSFQIEDTSYVNGRGISEYFGLQNVSKPGTNSSFTINGVTRQTHGNSFTYNNLMTITLNNVSEDPVLIEKSTDSDMIVNSLKDITDSYNALVDTANNNHDETNKSGRLLNSLAAATQYLKNSMESCGITIDATGHMVVDKTLAYQAADSGDLQNMLTDSDGLVSELKNKANEINLNPMEYINKTIVTYPNVSRPGVSNPYVTSIYSGMLFNYYC